MSRLTDILVSKGWDDASGGCVRAPQGKIEAIIQRLRAPLWETQALMLEEFLEAVERDPPKSRKQPRRLPPVITK